MVLWHGILLQEHPVSSMPLWNFLSYLGRTLAERPVWFTLSPWAGYPGPPPVFLDDCTPWRWYSRRVSGARAGEISIQESAKVPRAVCIDGFLDDRKTQTHKDEHKDLVKIALCWLERRQTYRNCNFSPGHRPLSWRYCQNKHRVRTNAMEKGM